MSIKNLFSDNDYNLRAQSMLINNDLNVGGTVSASSFSGAFFPSGSLSLTDTTQSTSSTTGALIVGGGVGISKDVYIGGNLNLDGILTTQTIVYEYKEVIQSTENSTSITTGSSVVNGGCGIAKDVYIGGQINVINTTTSTSTSTGSSVINGGCGIAKDVYIGGQINVINTTASTSTSTGSLITSGGVGISKDLYVGGIIQSGNDDVLKAPTGFENTTSSSMVYDPLTRIFTISPVSGSFNVWIAGKRYVYSSPQATTAHATTSGQQYFYYFTSSGLTYSTVFPDLRTSAVCCFVYYYDATHYIATEERHGCVMDADTHYELHKNIGTFYKSGLALNDYTVQPAVPANTHNSFSSESGVIVDEDLQSTISAQAVGSYTVLHLTGSSSLWTYEASTLPFLNDVGDYIKYNRLSGGSWDMYSIGNNAFTNMYVVYVPSTSTSTQMLLIPSQSTYSTLAGAQAEAFTNLTLGSMPFEEFLPRYKITFGSKNTYVNTGKCRIESITTLSGTKVSIISASVNNHQALSGLQLATTGSTYGHISDTTQSIYGVKTFADTTASTSSTTGALVIGGGLGVAKNLNVGYSINGYNTNSLMRNTFSNKTLGTRAVSTWTTRTAAASNSWFNICWSPELGIFCAVSPDGSGNRVMTSSDGITWTTRSTSGIDINWSCICWSSEVGLFCALAGSGTGNRVMTSPDGIIWTTRASAADNNWRCICWSPELGLFCAVASTGSGNRVMTSPDGITWTTRASAADNDWLSVCWSPELGLFCSVAQNGTGNRIMTSPDSITWTTRANPVANDWHSVCWSPELGIFCAVAYSGGGSGNRVMTSPDGITWTSRISAADNAWLSVCWSAELGLFCTSSTSGTGNRIMTSPDGIVWTTRASAANNSWRSICWSPELGIFCSPAEAASLVMTSKQVYDTKSRQNIKGSVNIIRSANQLSLNYDSTNKTTFDVSSGGDLTIDCSGNDLNLASTDVVRVLNTTASISTTTGALVVSGGLGVAKNIYAGNMYDGSFNVNWTGTYSKTTTIYYSVASHVFSLYCASTSDTSTSATYFSAAAGSFPVSAMIEGLYRQFIIPITDNGVSGYGTLVIQGNGSAQIYKNGGDNFTGSGTVIFSFSIAGY